EVGANPDEAHPSLSPPSLRFPGGFGAWGGFGRVGRRVARATPSSGEWPFAPHQRSGELAFAGDLSLSVDQPAFG
ncbi:MAG: hypothetical protein ACYC23_23780, partial [Limisphaerales bacterium]